MLKVPHCEEPLAYSDILTTLTIRLEVELAAFLKEDIIPLDLSAAL
jgi:hypothetical protein